MSLMPDEMGGRPERVNLAPMVDLFFLIIVALVCALVARSTFSTSELSWAALRSRAQEAEELVEKARWALEIDGEGCYVWREGGRHQKATDVAEVLAALASRQERGLLPEDPGSIQLLVHIDKRACWEAVAALFLAAREAGFTPLPLCEGVASAAAGG